MQLAGRNGSECIPPTNQPANQPTNSSHPLGCRRTAGQPRTWQPGNSQFLGWWKGFCQKYVPFQQLHRPAWLPVTPHRSIARALRDACRTCGEHVIL